MQLSEPAGEKSGSKVIDTGVVTESVSRFNTVASAEGVTWKESMKFCVMFEIQLFRAE